MLKGSATRRRNSATEPLGRVACRQAAEHPAGQVHIPLQQEVKVYRNDQWANFLHNRTTRLLLAISGFGLMSA